MLPSNKRQAPAIDLATPGFEEELRVVRRAAAVDQVLENHASDREGIAFRLLQNVTEDKHEAPRSLHDRSKVEQHDSKKCSSTGGSIDTDAKIQIQEKSDSAQSCRLRQAPQSDTDVDAWAHQQWTMYFGHAPDPWWYDRAWQGWH